MNNIAHVAFIDSHTERQRRSDDFYLTLYKKLLMARARFIGKTRMIIQRLKTAPLQIEGKAVGLFARFSKADT